MERLPDRPPIFPFPEKKRTAKQYRNVGNRRIVPTDAVELDVLFCKQGMAAMREAQPESRICVPYPQAARFRAAFASAAKFAILAKSRLSRASHSALATAYGKPFDEPLSTNRQCKEKTSLFWRGSICGSGLFLRLLMLRMSVTPLAAVTCKPRSLATSSAQPAASFTTDQHNSLSNTITSKRSLATSMPQKERCAIFVSLPC